MFSCFRVMLLNAVLLEARAFLARLPVVSGLVLRSGVVGRNISAAVPLLVRRLVLVAPSALGSRPFNSAGCQRAVPLQPSTVDRVQRSRLLASAAVEGSFQSGWWFALRAGVLRRAVSQSGRPARHFGASHTASGRQVQCPSRAGLSSTSMKHPANPRPWHSPYRRAFATKPWPNLALQPTANGLPCLGLHFILAQTRQPVVCG
mgnify:CR=1 FL=1